MLGLWAYDATSSKAGGVPRMMKRVTGVVVMAVSTVLVTAAAAIAQTSSYPLKPSATTVVKGASGSRGSGGGTAFTGSSQVPVDVLWTVGLLGVGRAALSIVRRRAVQIAG